MKRLLIALFICFVFSSVAQAGKTGLGTARNGSLVEKSHGPGEPGGIPYCTYTADSSYGVYVHARKDMMLAFELVTGNTSANLYTKFYTQTVSDGARYSPSFEVPAGTSWTLYWTLTRVKGKGHIIDVIEVESGSCG